MNPGVIAYIDGGSRGNPGPAGYGVRIEAPDGALVEEFHEAIGIATNNIAEYRGLLAALEWARAHGERQLHVRSDSQLLVQQMRGAYKVRHPGLQPLHARAQQLVREIGRVTFEHVGRERNVHADRLANAAMDDHESTSTPRSQPPSPRPKPARAEHAATNRQRPEQPSASSQHPFSAVERAVRLFIYRHFIDTAQAPDRAAIAGALGIADDEVALALGRLAKLHAIVLAPASLDIWMAHPFSAVPTAYRVVANGMAYFANCAWDALGAVSLLGIDGECRTRCVDCGAELMMRIRSGRIEGDGIVHFAVPPRVFWKNVAYT